MKTTKIICDHCDKDLTQTGRMPAFRLALSSEEIQQTPGITYTVNLVPPILIGKGCHFCSLICLRDWALERIKGIGSI